MPVSAAGAQTPDWGEVRILSNSRAHAGAVQAMAPQGVMPPFPFIFLTFISHAAGTDFMEVGRGRQPEDTFKFGLTLEAAQTVAAQLLEAVRRAE